MIQGLPEKLKRLRLQNGLSQKDVAERLVLSPSVISSYETGERTPSTEALLNLSALYKCSVDYLLGNDSDSSQLLDVTGLSEKQIQAIKQLINSIR